MHNLPSGVGAGLKKSVPGYALLHKNVTKVGSQLRSVTQKRNQGRSRLRSVTQRVTKASSWLRSVTRRRNQCLFAATLKRNQGRFLVTLGYTKT